MDAKRLLTLRNDNPDFLPGRRNDCQWVTANGRRSLRDSEPKRVTFISRTSGTGTAVIAARSWAAIAAWPRTWAVPLRHRHELGRGRHVPRSVRNNDPQLLSRMC